MGVESITSVAEVADDRFVDKVFTIFVEPKERLLAGSDVRLSAHHLEVRLVWVIQVAAKEHISNLPLAGMQEGSLYKIKIIYNQHSDKLSLIKKLLDCFE